MIFWEKKAISRFKKMPCATQQDARALTYAIRDYMVRRLKSTGMELINCRTCSDLPSLLLPYTETPIALTQESPAACMIPGNACPYLACFREGEVKYIPLLEEEGIPVTKALSLLGIESLYCLPPTSQEEDN